MTKILIDEATVKLALEALKQIDNAMPFPVAKLAQAALQKALAKDVPETNFGNMAEQPAQRTWVGLTAKDWNVIGFTAEFRAGAEWANDKLKEKNA